MSTTAESRRHRVPHRYRVLVGVVCVACMALAIDWTQQRIAKTPTDARVGSRDLRRDADARSLAGGAASRITPGTPVASAIDPGIGDDAGESPEQVRLNAVLRAHWERVARDGDARQRLIALKALDIDADDASRRRTRVLAAAALAEAPGDPLVAQMQAWFCEATPDECSPAQRDAWARLEPRNAAALADVLERTDSDAARTDALVAHAANGDRYESHYHALILETVAAMDDLVLPPISPEVRRQLASAGLPVTDATYRRATVAGVAFALPMPNLLGISRACKPPVSAWRARDCRIVLARMAGARTLVERMIAYSLLSKLTAGTAEGAHWAAQNRRLRWWLHQFREVVTDDPYWNDFLRFGEVEAVRRALIATRRPLDPPIGWRAD